MMKGSGGGQGGATRVEVAPAPVQEGMGPVAGAQADPVNTGRPKNDPDASPAQQPSRCTTFWDACKEKATNCCTDCMDGCGECAGFA